MSQMILVLRTDKPEAEIGLFDGSNQVAYETWQAHRQLAETIHKKINGLLTAQGRTLGDISGIVVYRGPGSFTGLRIGVSVANALAYAQDVPIAAATGEDWIQTGIKELENAPAKRPVVPEYGAPAAVTQPKK